MVAKRPALPDQTAGATDYTRFSLQSAAPAVWSGNTAKQILRLLTGHQDRKG